MSAETKATLDEALAAHVADELDGAIVVAYVCQAAAMTSTDFDAEQTQYLRMVAAGQNARHARHPRLRARPLPGRPNR